MSVEVDIVEAGRVATVTLAGASTPLGAVHWEGAVWAAVAVDEIPVGTAGTRGAAVQLLLSDWQKRIDGAAECSPTSVMALARELHRHRGCGGYVKRQQNWLCHCNRDAHELNDTQWLKDVVTVLGGTFPDQRPGSSRG